MAGPTGNNLRSVAMVSAGEGWAVGDGGTILHYTGGSWQSAASPTLSTALTMPPTLPLRMGGARLLDAREACAGFPQPI